MDRRRHRRVPLEIWVEQWTPRESYLQKSANISRGGIYLDKAVPHPEGTLLNLRFTLPGDEAPIECTGRIVYPRTGDDFGMGLEFESLPPEAQARVEAFLRRSGPETDSTDAPSARGGPPADGPRDPTSPRRDPRSPRTDKP